MGGGERGRRIGIGKLFSWLFFSSISSRLKSLSLSTVLSVLDAELQGFVNDRSNVCYVEGPLRLYDRYDREKGTFYYVAADGNEVDGLNPHVMARILQMLIKE